MVSKSGYAYVVIFAAWVNRFANAGDTAIVVAGNTAERVRDYFITLFSRFFFFYPGGYNMYMLPLVIFS